MVSCLVPVSLVTAGRAVTQMSVSFMTAVAGRAAEYMSVSFVTTVAAGAVVFMAGAGLAVGSMLSPSLSGLQPDDTFHLAYSGMSLRPDGLV